MRGNPTSHRRAAEVNTGPKAQLTRLPSCCICMFCVAFGVLPLIRANAKPRSERLGGRLSHGRVPPLLLRGCVASPAASQSHSCIHAVLCAATACGRGLLAHVWDGLLCPNDSASCRPRAQRVRIAPKTRARALNSQERRRFTSHMHTLERPMKTQPRDTTISTCTFLDHTGAPVVFGHGEERTRVNMRPLVRTYCAAVFVLF